MIPTYTLHKTSEGFIITSDEEIKENDNFIIESTIGTDFFTILTANKADAKNTVKSRFKVISKQDQIDLSHLSSEEKERIGWFDVEKLSYDWLYENEENMPKGYPLKPMEYGFKQGFQKALELLSDKRFTLEDILNVLDSARMISHVAMHDDGGYKIIYSKTEEQIMESLSQPKSWKVELEMEYQDGFGYWYLYEDIMKNNDHFIPLALRPKMNDNKLKILKIV